MEQTAIFFIVFVYWFLFIAALSDVPQDINAMKSAVSRKRWRENHRENKGE